jgi:rhodanese-related sulfurtransferase
MTGSSDTEAPAANGTAPDDAERVAALGAALAAAEARIHELDVQLASERQAADVRRGHLLAAEARAAAAEAALREVAALHQPGPEGAPDDRVVPVPAAVIRRAALAARAAPGSP